MKTPAIVAISVAAALQGCATDTMTRVMTSWHGEHIEAVVRQWGYPNAERDFLGRKLYVWNDSSTYILPSFTSSSGSVVVTSPRSASIYSTTTGFGGGPIHGQCERIIEVDDRGIVQAGQWRGNNCCIATIAGHCATLPNPARQ